MVQIICSACFLHALQSEAGSFCTAEDEGEGDMESY